MTTYTNGATTNQKPLSKVEFMNLAMFRSNRSLKIRDLLEQEGEHLIETNNELNFN